MIPWGIYAIFVGSSLLLIVLGLPMALGKIPPNNWYGFRTPVTMRSRAGWYAANIQYGWWTVLAGVLSLPFAIYGCFVSTGASMIWVYVAVMLVPMGVGFAPSLIAARRAEMRAEEDSEEQERDELPDQFRR